jgi:transcriptional regulator with XRE-family HTH domain
MKLKTYREQNGLTLEAMAARVAEKLGKRVDLQIIHRIERGQLPKRDMAKAIVEATDGQVTPNDFYDLGEDRAA